MDFFPLELAGRTYRLRFTPDDVRDICRRLTPLQPPGGAKVSSPLLGTMLVNLDPDAIELCMLYGLRHMAEYKKADLPDMQKLISNAIKGGAQYTDFRRPLFRALIACGLADFAPVMKVLDEAEAESGTADPERSEAEADAGNRLTRLETRSSTPPLSVVDFDASTSRDG